MRNAYGWSLVLALVLASFASAGPVQATDESGTPDMTGDYVLDLDRSDRPAGPPAGMGRGGPGGGPPGGMSGPPRGGMGGGPPGGPGGPPSGGGGAPDGARARGPAMRLPHRVHVTQTARLVSFEDSTGAVVREVVTISAKADTFTHAPRADVVYGAWKRQKLETQRPGPFDTPIVETYTLEAKGRQLVIRTELPGNGDMPARTIKRVYRRVEE